MRNISVNYYEFGPLFHKEMWFKDIYYLELWQPLCLKRGTICAILVIHHEKQFCEIILNLDTCCRRR